MAMVVAVAQNLEGEAMVDQGTVDTDRLPEREATRSKTQVPVEADHWEMV
ncbi:MAG: hypothetical protein V2A34_08935 [Lentisphaerota bacterium]